MEELSVLCGIPTCSVISGPGDTKPKIWPSPEVAKQLLQRLEEVPKGVKSRKVVTQLSFMRDKTKKLENQLARLKERNNEKYMSILMHQIHHDGSSSMGLQPPHANLSDVDKVCPKRIFYSGGLISESDSRLGAFHLENLEVSLCESDHLGSEVWPPQGNFGGLNGESDSGVLPQDNFGVSMVKVWPGGNIGDLNDGSDLLEMYNFEGLNGESGDSSQVFTEGIFGDLNDGRLLNGSSIDEIGGSNIWPFYGHFESTIDGSYMEIEQHNENHGGFINNSGTNTHEAAMGRFDANFVGNNNGNNLNFGLPTHGNFASSSEFGSDTQVPTSLEESFLEVIENLGTMLPGHS
ncbi:hypothetical protein SESBI_25281 [Sesbania bispinosa]|nr:hypothetical protein SESBI_25281 [Sesbania bispinosa]